ncbi:MAG: DEAD/DEAH box helicase [Deltaproteobacteria bacterium]
MTFYRPRRSRSSQPQRPHHPPAASPAHRPLAAAPPAAPQVWPALVSAAIAPAPGDASPFAALGLAPVLVRAVEHEGYERPTPIQLQAIPHVLAGKDLLGCAQTGTGKTAAFLLPMLQRLSGRRGNGQIRALILTPTRELAAQIGESATAYGRHAGLRHTVIYGGVGQRPQEDALRRGVDLLIATPGRLIDLMGQGFARLGSVEIFVLDEADRMLDMGFVHDVRRIVASVPRVRQTLLFSATIPPAIETLAHSILHEPVSVAVTPAVTTAEGVDQVLYYVQKTEKPALLLKLLQGPEITRALVFTRTKHGADRVHQRLEHSGIESVAIHGNKSQNARNRALDGFRSGETRILVATDIAARGIDVTGVSHVINYDLPNEPESYVHRIGRTGRAGAVGSAISFCDGEEIDYLRSIERLIRRPIPVAGGTVPARSAAPSLPPRRSGGGRSHAGGRRHGGRR